MLNENLADFFTTTFFLLQDMFEEESELNRKKKGPVSGRVGKKDG
jgi:hypothetical protein